MQIKTIKLGIDNCYLIKQEGTILVDGGMPVSYNHFSKKMVSLGIDPKEIKAIILTHCHWDHIGCAKALQLATGARVIVHKNEQSRLEKGQVLMPPGVTRWGKIFGAFLNWWIKRIKIKPCKVDIVVGDEGKSLEEFGINGKIVFTPGHSPGSVSIVLDTGEAFVGDLAMRGMPLTLGANLPIFAEDISGVPDSWRKLYEMGVKKIYPAHGKPFPIEKILKKI